MNEIWRGFASDNYAAAHPDVLKAMMDVNQGHQVAYGEDESTKQLGRIIKEHFGADAEVFPVFNGTGSNVAALSALMQRWEAVICAHTRTYQTTRLWFWRCSPIPTKSCVNHAIK